MSHVAIGETALRILFSVAREGAWKAHRQCRTDWAGTKTASIDYLTVDRMTEGSVMPQPVGWVLLIYGHIPHQRAWREVFETREAAMQAGADWFLALDVVSWD